MISLHNFIYGLGLAVIAVALYFVIIELQLYLDKRRDKKIKLWNEEILRNTGKSKHK